VSWRNSLVELIESVENSSIEELLVASSVCSMGTISTAGEGVSSVGFKGIVSGLLGELGGEMSEDIS
jgi:hypothetical protein